MSISIDSSNSLSELNITEPVSGHSHKVRCRNLSVPQIEILTSTKLHPINEIAHLEDAGDMTIMEYS